MAEIGIRDGIMQLALLAQSEAEVEQAARSTAEVVESTNGGYSYYGLWHILTRVRWLLRVGRATEAVDVALDALPRVTQMADRALLERMKLVAAEGLTRTGRTADAAHMLARAVADDHDPPLEMVAEVARVAGCVAASDNQAAAVAHFERASRILSSLGNITARGEVVLNATCAFAAAEGVPLPDAWPDLQAHYRVPRRVTIRYDTSEPVVSDPRSPAAAAVETASALMQLAAHPGLLGHEVLSLVAQSGAAARAALVSTQGADRHVLACHACDSAEGALLAEEPDVCHLDLGSHGERRVEVVARPAPAPSARSTLSAIDRLVRSSRELQQARRREREQAALWPEQTSEQQLGMIYASDSMVQLVKTAHRLAASNITVLITGETGTGKELLARALHEASPRREATFVPFNCTAVAREMLDAQLFGYRRGAFTGAQEAFQGVIRAAAGGTLFLDEIGEIGPDVQPKLLRFLESGEIHPLGEPRPLPVDVRIVAATNANLDALVTEGRFREDLFYRLNVVQLHIPPLRERREEIPLLVEYFLEKFSRESKKPGLTVAEQTMEYLVLYRWPGNVRQLGNELRRMVALAELGAVLMPEHLSRDIAASRRTIPASERDLAPTEVVVRLDQPLPAATEHLERSMIEFVMKETGGRMEDAARTLGLSRKGLYLKRQRLGLN